MRKLLNSNFKSTQGFTLVETLIAITVLMIAIAGPLVIATKGLTSALYSKDQMIASFLAQESMEVIKNRHDNNIADGTVDWLYNLGTVGSNYDVSSLNLLTLFSCTVDTSTPGCPIYYSDSSGYTNNPAASGAKQTQFYRHFYIEPKINSNSSEVAVHVIVDWYEKSIPFQIHLTSSMIAVSR